MEPYLFRSGLRSSVKRNIFITKYGIGQTNMGTSQDNMQVRKEGLHYVIAIKGE
jgi:hypothetical protein